MDVPGCIDEYFRAVAASDNDGLVACFTSDGEVTDEDRVHTGREAIRAWRAQTKAAYQYTAEVLNVVPDSDERYTVTAKLTGTFPGSPIELSYRFTLRGGLIGRLDIGA